jgi:hypothetical protein
MEPRGRWEVGTDVEEVHALLLRSDAHHAIARAPAPTRRRERTRDLVAAGSVQVLRADGQAISSFALTWEAPFDSAPAGFPSARRPLYLSRLAVEPRWLASEPMIGIRTLRRAIELATSHRVDALRAEANPDLPRVAALLQSAGFKAYGQTRSEHDIARIYLQKDLA